jgi:hypothetical protein
VEAGAPLDAQAMLVTLVRITTIRRPPLSGTAPPFAERVPWQKQWMN